jgi:hypothetical protein
MFSRPRGLGRRVCDQFRLRGSHATFIYFHDTSSPPRTRAMKLRTFARD